MAVSERHRTPGRRVARAVLAVLSVAVILLGVGWLAGCSHEHPFAAWIIFGVEDYPYGLHTMIVSLEAIFLSTFVMISQNRSDEKSQVVADERWQTVQQEEKQNEQLLALSGQILELTGAIHAMSSAQATDTAVDQT